MSGDRKSFSEDAMSKAGSAGLKVAKKAAKSVFHSACKYFGTITVVFLILPALLMAMLPDLLWNVIFHMDNKVDKWEGTDKELKKNGEDVKENTDKYAQIIMDALSGSSSAIESQIKAHCGTIKINGKVYKIDYQGSLANVDDETGFYEGMGDGSSTSDGGEVGGGDDAEVSQTGAAIAKYAQKWIGYNYVLGTQAAKKIMYKGGPKKNGHYIYGLDCAGFVRYCYQHAHFKTNAWDCGTLQNNLAKYQVGGRNPSHLAKGDIIIFGTKTQHAHTAIYIGNGMIMSASSPEVGIIKTTLKGTVAIHGGTYYAYRPFPKDSEKMTRSSSAGAGATAGYSRNNAAKEDHKSAKKTTKKSTKKNKHKKAKAANVNQPEKPEAKSTKGKKNTKKADSKKSASKGKNDDKSQSKKDDKGDKKDSKDKKDKKEGTIKVIHGLPKNAPYVYKTLRSYGYDEIAAIGIMSCWWAESSFNPAAVNKQELASHGANYAGSGIAQWTDGRNPRMKNWVSKKSGHGWASLKWQVAYFQHEVRTSYTSMRPSLANKNNTLFDAMHYCLVHYEGCDGAKFRSTRLGYAKKLYAALHGINPDDISGDVVGDDGASDEGGSGFISGRFMGEILSSFSVYEDSMTGGWKEKAKKLDEDQQNQDNARKQDGQAAYETELDSLYNSYTPPGAIRDIKQNAHGLVQDAKNAVTGKDEKYTEKDAASTKLSDDCVKELDDLYSKAKDSNMTQEELEKKAKGIIADKMADKLNGKKQERIDMQEKADEADSIANWIVGKVEDFGKNLFQPDRDPEADLKNIMSGHTADFFKITYGKPVKSGKVYVYSSITIQPADIRQVMKKCFDLDPDGIYSSKISKDKNGKPLPLAGKHTTNYQEVMQTTDDNMEMLYNNKSGGDGYGGSGGGDDYDDYDGSGGKLKWPCSHTTISCEFGTKRSWDPYAKKGHSGMDIAVPAGTPVHSPGDGIVKFAGTYGGYGNCIMISHGDGIVSLFGHLRKIGVHKGQKVKTGDVIGKSGGVPGEPGSGFSNGAHLHFEVQKNGKPVNPRNYLTKKSK